MNQFKFLLLAAIASLFIGGIYLTSTTKVEAQLKGFGISCIMNNSNCGTGGLNIQQLIDENKVEYASDANKDDFQQSVLSSHPSASDLGEVCVPETYLDANGDFVVFPVNRDGSPATQAPNPDDSSVYDSDLTADVVPRVCGAGRVLTSIVKSPYLEYLPYSGLCCPSGYAGVGRADSVTDHTKNNTHDSACCLIPDDPSNNNTPDFYMNVGGVLTCYSRTNLVDAKPLIYSGRQSAMTKVINDDATRGLPLGTPLKVVPRTGSNLSCLNKDGCALVPADTSAAGFSLEKFKSNGSDIAIIDPVAFESTPNLQCNQCYDVGEAMVITDPTETEEGKLLVCAGNGAITKRALVNNNIADTLAVLEAEKNGDPTNAAFIEQCRAQGGLPTALGCIDTTPVGIITNLIRIALGTMGGVALLQLILVGLRYMQGDEGEIKKAREQLIATLTGLATLVFSVLILRILGVNILDIIPSGTI